MSNPLKESPASSDPAVDDAASTDLEPVPGRRKFFRASSALLGAATTVGTTELLAQSDSVSPPAIPLVNNVDVAVEHEAQAIKDAVESGSRKTVSVNTATGEIEES